MKMVGNKISSKIPDDLISVDYYLKKKKALSRTLQGDKSNLKINIFFLQVHDCLF